MKATLFSQLFLVKRMRLGVAVCILYMGIGLLYAVAGSGAWVSTGGEGEFLGFSADPSYLLTLGIDSMAISWPLVVSLSHTVLFPVVAVAVMGMMFGAGGGNAAGDVSCSRGSSSRRLFYAKVIIGSAYALIGYLVFSLAAYAGIAIAFGPQSIASTVSDFICRLFGNSFVNLSYLIVCATAFSAFRSKALASGSLLVAVFAGLVIAMSFSDSIIPTHMAYWMRMCGISGSLPLARTIAYSLASAGAFLLVYEVAYVWKKSKS